MTNAIVSDTGALISLEKLTDGFNIIGKLYDKMIIPPKVAEELASRYDGLESYLERYDIREFIEIRKPKRVMRLQGIHAGEGQAIPLALELGLPLLIEERKGRKVAGELGVLVAGVAQVVFKAFENSVINRDEALRLLQELLEKRRINNRVYQVLFQDILKFKER